MARQTKVRRSGIFLLELMIAILFFSVAGAVCTRVFVEARAMSREAGTLSEAVAVCGNAAEAIRAADCPEEAERNLRRVFPELEQQNETWRGVLDSGNVLEIGVTGDALSRYEVRFLCPDGTCLHALTVSRYYQEVRP